MNTWTPAEIVKELNRYIVGQDEAKRAVAVALRNRYRRMQLPEEIRLAARDYDPSHVNRYLITLAGDFHRFYNACRIKGEEARVLAARLKLADTVRAVIANCLGLIGVTAPEKM